MPPPERPPSDSPPSDKAARYRAEALRIRSEAEALTDPAARAQLLKLADLYEHLASYTLRGTDSGD